MKITNLFKYKEMTTKSCMPINTIYQPLRATVLCLIATTTVKILPNGPVKKYLNWSSKHLGKFMSTGFLSRMTPNVFEINEDRINKISLIN